MRVCVLNPSVSKPNIIFTMQSFKPCQLASMGGGSLLYIHRFTDKLELATVCFSFRAPSLKRHRLQLVHREKREQEICFE